MGSGVQISSNAKAARGSRLCRARAVHPVDAEGLIALSFDVVGSDEVIRVALPWREAKSMLQVIQEYLEPNPQDPQGAPVLRDRCHRLV